MANEILYQCSNCGMSHVDIAGRGFDLAVVRRVISEATAKDETLYPMHRGMQV